MKKCITIQYFAVFSKMSKFFLITIFLNIVLFAPAFSQTKYYSNFSNSVAPAHVVTHPDQIVIPLVATVALGTFATPESVANIDTTDFSHYTNAATVITNISLLTLLLPDLNVYAQADLNLGSNNIASASLPAGSVAGFVIDNQPGLINVNLGTLVTMSTYLNNTLQETSTTPQSTLVPSISSTAQDIHFVTTKPFNQVRAALSGSLLSLNINLDPTKGTDFYFAYGISSAVVLPVSFTQFTATSQANGTILNWATATETNNSGFAIERSADGVDFNQISFIASKAIGGNSNLALNYSTLDASPLTGINYYRLKQIDFDGHATYSNVKSVTSLANSSIYKIYPNPASDFVNIQVASAGNYLVELFSIDGKRLQASQLTAGSGLLSFLINKTNVPVGVYSLKVTKSDDGKNVSNYSSILIK